MKKLLVSVLVVICVAVSFGFIRATHEPSEVIFVRGFVFVYGLNSANTVKIYRGTAPVEIIPLERNNSVEGFDNEINKIMETVNKLSAQGYQVVSTTESGTNGAVILNFTMVK